ncbi:LuxE/PaaK family acyltransferase [Dyadobacter aurulentus]|uniref:LuxE/PaaK family acyltransferase n=1 Tax=Dyadobacter sp. UC 10 TaxID=2605428 RepID=UPI0011F38FC2|nr:acyl transferase [Dyadobacter sp. UC 10]KAA0991835.1 acyl transferase [Dyadobacter sp. UC 10]
MALQNNIAATELRQRLRNQVLTFDPSDFDELALQIFRYQAEHNLIYNQFINHLNINTEHITCLTDIPFLPIQFFKTHTITTGSISKGEVTFQSSGTTGQQTSHHNLYDPALYRAVSTQIFEEKYGALGNFHILALLPSYLERNNSSLVYMLQHFIEESGSPFSGFYLHNTSEMLKSLENLTSKPDGRKILLIGVTFALLDLAESDYDLRFLQENRNLMIMDTGGMKGRRREMLREEVHDILIHAFGVDHIHSEYGMTELLSQGYSGGAGLFTPGRTMRIFLRDINDPLSVYDHNISGSKTGGINVIDLANLDTCSFIETQDLGRFGNSNGSFYVMGRFDNSDIRGCNLMIL